MDESETETAEHDEEPLTMSTSLRILVVDDDATFLAVISGLLKILKHEVVTFRNPLHALSTLGVKKSDFDLVITDVHMPQIDGFEMQKRVQDDFKLPLINKLVISLQ
nr:two-component response regulator ARR11-like [Ziziphus jujuba var. spinosa]